MECIDKQWTYIYQCLNNPYCALNGPAEGDGFAVYPGDMNLLFKDIEQYIVDADSDGSSPVDPLV